MIKKNLILKINDKILIRDVLKKIQKSSRQIVYLTDNNNRLIGSITDGDIRRSLLNGYTLDSSIKDIYFKKTNYIKKKLNKDELIKFFENKKINSVPLIKNKKIKEIIFLNDLLKKNTKNKKKYDVVIMAGGYGKRLMPLTRKTPKCLVKINKKKRIIDFVIDNIKKYDVNNIHFITYYKSSKVIKYVSKKYESKFNLFFYKEKKPLGTAGGLKVLYKNKNLSDNFILINSDVISKIDLTSLISFHEKNKSIFTLVTKLVQQKLSFGTIKNIKEVLQTIQEKPTISYFVNAGIYLISKKLLKFIPNNSKDYKMTDLISKLKLKKIKIKIFHLYEDWHDVGSHEKLNELRRKFKNKLI